MTTDEPTTDAVFDALADDLRRAVLAYVREVGEASVEELAAVVGRQTGRGNDHGTAVAVRLHHVHLPKLADAGLVVYDPSARRVEYVGGSEIEDLLATAPRETVAE